MPNNNEVTLSLSTICGGNLEREFQEIYPALLANLDKGGKASVTITVELQRVKDTSTMVNVGYKLTPKWPARSRASVCQVTDDGTRIMTEKSAEKSQVLMLFDEAKEVTTNGQ